MPDIVSVDTMPIEASVMRNRPSHSQPLREDVLADTITATANELNRLADERLKQYGRCHYSLAPHKSCERLRQLLEALDSTTTSYELVQSPTSYGLTVEDARELDRHIYINELKQLSKHDGLTGILSKAGLFDHLHENFTDYRVREEKIEEREINGQKYNWLQHPTGCVLVLDIDHFKPVNDRYGHPTGDDILRDFAQGVGGSIRDGDLFSRYGGEEFVVILPGASPEQAMEVYKRLQQGFTATLMANPSLPEPLRSKTFSAGIAPYTLEELKTIAEAPTREEGVNRIQTFITPADKALKIAKDTGRARAVIAQ